MPTQEILDLDVCQDCLLYLANGEVPEPMNDWHWSDDPVDEEGNRDRYATAVFPRQWHPRNIDTRWDGWDLIGSCAREDCRCVDNVGDYDWSHCDTCGSELEGNRYHATAMRQVFSDLEKLAMLNDDPR